MCVGAVLLRDGAVDIYFLFFFTSPSSFHFPPSPLLSGYHGIIILFRAFSFTATKSKVLH